MNKVIAGDYKGKSVACPLWSKPRIIAAGLKVIIIDKSTVADYDVVNGVNQLRNDKNQISITFKDGKRSLLEVDDRIFKEITVALF